jgi:hypothetical protein
VVKVHYKIHRMIVASIRIVLSTRRRRSSERPLEYVFWYVPDGASGDLHPQILWVCMKSIPDTCRRVAESIFVGKRLYTSLNSRTCRIASWRRGGNRVMYSGDSVNHFEQY